MTGSNKIFSQKCFSRNIEKQHIIIFIGTNSMTQLCFHGRRHVSRLLFSFSLEQAKNIGLGVRVFANGLGDLGSIPGRVIPKTQKMVLDASLLNTQHYKVRIKGKVEQSREGVAPSPTHWCSSYRKVSLRVTLDYGRQLYFTYEWEDLASS